MYARVMFCIILIIDGQLFIEFLINCNLCMRYGRNYIKKDFTRVSSKICM